MKRFVSVWNMPKSKKAFTLMEVMVAVIIISVVIMALLEMQGNNSHMFTRFSSQIKITQYSSFLISNKDYGFEKDSVYLDDLLSEFRVEDDLRRELKEIKAEIVYEELDRIDMSESDEDDEGESNSSIIFEIGKTILNVNDQSTVVMRFKIQ